MQKVMDSFAFTVFEIMYIHFVITPSWGKKYFTNYILTVSEVLNSKHHFSSRKFEYLILMSDLQHASLHIGEGFYLACAHVSTFQWTSLALFVFLILFFSYNAFHYLLIVTVFFYFRNQNSNYWSSKHLQPSLLPPTIFWYAVSASKLANECGINWDGKGWKK